MGGANIQVQIGDRTAAAAVIAGTALQTQDPANQTGVVHAVVSILNQSLDSGTIWILTGELPNTDTEENTSSEPTDNEQTAESGYPQTQAFNLPADRRYVFNKTGNIMFAWAGPETEKVSIPASKLFNEAARFYTKMIKKITDTINPITDEPYSIYNYKAIIDVINQSDMFVRVAQENINYRTTSFGSNYSKQLIETLLGIDLQPHKLPFAQNMIASLGSEGLKIAGGNSSSDDKVANIIFICEYLCDVPLVSAIVVSCDVQQNLQTFEVGPCFKESSTSTSLTMDKETFVFTDIN